MTSLYLSRINHQLMKIKKESFYGNKPIILPNQFFHYCYNLLVPSFWPPEAYYLLVLIMKISKYYNYFTPLLEFLNIKIKLSKLTFPFFSSSYN